MTISLISEHEIQTKIDPCRAKIMAQLTELLPAARIEEIGSTAIPGAITKGDLDVLVVVGKKEFDAVQNRLSEIYEKNVMEPIGFFESFKGEAEGVEFGIQLATPENQEFRFVVFRDLLMNSPKLVEQYNKIKLEAVSSSMDEYREQKYRFIESVLPDN